MKRASIDIGSNSVLLLVADVDPEKLKISEILDESAITSLGKDLDKTGVFQESSMIATYEALKNYAMLCRKAGISPSDVIVTATEASRIAKNAPEFYKKIKSDFGFSTQVISGVGEAYYTALGVTSSICKESETIVIMDIGGASTELIKIQVSPFKILSTISFPLGSVRAMDWQTTGVFEVKILEILQNDFSKYETDELICVAGSMTALAGMYLGLKEFSAERIEGKSISFSSFKDFSRDLQNTNVENLLLLFPFLGKRAPMVGPGSVVASIIAEKLKVDRLKISTRGLRYGTVISGGVDEKFISK